MNQTIKGSDESVGDVSSPVVEAKDASNATDTSDRRETVSGGFGSTKGGAKPDARGTHPNNVRKLRIERMMSKAELARRASLSVLTIDRVEKGYPCRLGTKRKILEALDLGLAERVRVFGEEE